MSKKRTPDKPTIGIIPSFDFDSEIELRRWIPKDVSALLYKTDDVASHEAVSMVSALSRPELLIEPTRQLCRQGVEAVVYACTACSFMGGHDGERALRSIMCREGASIARTTSGAVVEAFRTLNAYRVAIVHPYVAEVGSRLECFIDEAGFEVVSINGLGLQPAEVNTLEPESIGDIVRQTVGCVARKRVKLKRPKRCLV